MRVFAAVRACLTASRRPERSFRLKLTSTQRRPVRRVDALTKTQVAIVDLIAEGRTDKEIACRTGMSYRTVRTHLERLYNLNDVHCRAALVALVAERRRGAEPWQESRNPDLDLREPRPDGARPSR